MQIVQKKVSELIPYEKNPRKNDLAVEYVANSIKEFGFKVPIVIDKNNVVVAGHTRLRASKQLGLDEVPCIVADDLTEEQIKAFRLADNKTSEFSEWDIDLLSDEMSDIFDINMSDFGFEILDDFENDTKRNNINIIEQYQIVIDCDDEKDMNVKYNIVSEMGMRCHVLTL